MLKLLLQLILVLFDSLKYKPLKMDLITNLEGTKALECRTLDCSHDMMYSLLYIADFVLDIVLNIRQSVNKK